MKLFKKVTAAVAMAAVCFSMTVPVTANAGTAIDPAECGHNVLRLTRKYQPTTSRTHLITKMTDDNNDGTYDTYIHSNCTHTRLLIYDVYLCDYCHVVVTANLAGILEHPGSSDYCSE